MQGYSTSGRKKIIKDLRHYVSATLASQGFSLIRAVCLPLLFSPSQMGLWNVMNVIVGYCANAHLGLLHGMNKEIPFLQAARKDNDVNSVKNSIFWANFVLAILTSIGLLTVTLFIDTLYRPSLYIVSVLVFLQLIFCYYFSLLRADSKFALVSGGVLWLSISTTIFVLIFGYFYIDNLNGALTGLTLSYFSIVCYWLIKSKYHFSFSINFKIVKHVFLLGIPLILIGLLDSVTMSVDRWVIATHLKETELGYYALGIMASGLLSLIPSSISSVLYPRMLQKFAVQRNSGDLHSLLVTPMRVIWVLMLVLICFTIIILPLSIDLFIPKYLPSIPIIEIFILGSFFISSSHLPGNLIISVNKQNWLIATQIFVGLQIFIVDSILINKGFGLKGVAIGTVMGYAVYGISYSMIATYLVTKKTSVIIWLTLKQIVPFILLSIVFYTTKNIFIEDDTISIKLFSALYKLMSLLSIIIFSLWLVNRDGKVADFLLKEFKTMLK